MTVDMDELRAEYERLCAETHEVMCFALLSYDDPNYPELSKRVWDLMERREEMKRLISLTMNLT